MFRTEDYRVLSGILRASCRPDEGVGDIRWYLEMLKSELVFWGGEMCRYEHNEVCACSL